MQISDVTNGFGTGALVHQDDARDFQISRIPAVAALNPSDLPRVVDYSDKIWYIYNQGVLPACVTYSTATIQTGYQRIEGEDRIYDAQSVYWEVGGDGRVGVPTASVLKYARDKGFPVLKDTKRNPIASYAYTRNPMDIVAALAAGKLCVMAMLLPTDFWKGNCESKTRTGSYHQIAAVGYNLDTERLIFANSWGPSYGIKGFGSVRFDYLTADNYQGGYFYGYTTLDVIDGATKPVPVLAISGYEDAAGIPLPLKDGVYTIKSGNKFFVVGKGFGDKIGAVFSGNNVLRIKDINGWSDTRIGAEMYTTTVEVTDTIRVKPVVPQGVPPVEVVGPQIKVVPVENIPIPSPYEKYTIHPLVRRFGSRILASARVYNEKKVGTSKVPVTLYNNGEVLGTLETGRSGSVGWVLEGSISGNLKFVLGNSNKSVEVDIPK